MIGLFLAAALAASPVERHVIVRDFRTVKDGVCVNFNIGTAAHGPSSVAQVLKYMPGTKVTVWADAPLSDEEGVGDVRKLVREDFNSLNGGQE